MGFSVFRFWPFFRSVFRFFHLKTSVFRFWCLLLFVVFPFLSIWFSVSGQNTSGFWDLASVAVFGFSIWFPVSLWQLCTSTACAGQDSVAKLWLPREFSDSLQTQTLACVRDFLFPISYILFLVSGFLFPVSQKNWIGVCGPLPKTLTLFMTKICDFPCPIYDLTKNLRPYL